MIEPWPVLTTRTEAHNRIFTLQTLECQSPRTGRTHDFYVLAAGDWVNLIPLTPANEVLLVRQYRHGTKEITLEIPGGLIEHGMTPAEAAAAELLEETGHSSEDLILLGRIRPNPAILNNWCYSFLAQGTIQVGHNHLDETEDLEVVQVPLARIPDLIWSGQINHALVLSAFFMFLKSVKQAKDVFQEE